MESPATNLAPEQALNDIRGMMARSSRFLSLSGWSGVWAGLTALAAAAVAYYLIGNAGSEARWTGGEDWLFVMDALTIRLLLLAAATFITAFIGAYFFTARKARQDGGRLWNATSRQLMWQVMIPMIAGGVFCLAFLRYGIYSFLAPACLTFYGLGLVNGSKYTLGEIRWLGYCEVVLGAVCLFMPHYGLIFMAAGFGVLHILYGIIMWSKYDKKSAA